MRRQIAELKGEAARADGEHKGQADPERYLFAVVFASILPPVNIGESHPVAEDVKDSSRILIARCCRP
jgi:hypothetical protein